MAFITKNIKKNNRRQILTNKDRERHKIYSSSAWQRVRKAYLIEHPFCERCDAEGRITPAVDVHHIKSFVGIEDADEQRNVAYDYNNLMSLCKICHQLIHNARR